METQDKWINDIEAGELINLKNTCSVWIYRNRSKTEDREAAYTLSFAYYGKTPPTYLHYESSELLFNALAHYTKLLGAVDLDVTQKPITL